MIATRPFQPYTAAPSRHNLPHVLSHHHARHSVSQTRGRAPSRVPVGCPSVRISTIGQPVIPLNGPCRSHAGAPCPNLTLTSARWFAPPATSSRSWPAIRGTRGRAYITRTRPKLEPGRRRWSWFGVTSPTKAPCQVSIPDTQLVRPGRPAGYISAGRDPVRGRKLRRQWSGASTGAVGPGPPTCVDLWQR